MNGLERRTLASMAAVAMLAVVTHAGAEQPSPAPVAADATTLQAAAKSGCDAKQMRGCLDLAIYELLGRGTQRDPAAAFGHLSLVCDSDPGASDSDTVARACVQVGLSNQLGRGVPVDGAKASTALERGCTQLHDRTACADLGFLYRTGAPGVTLDAKRGATYLQTACTGAGSCSITGCGCNELGWMLHTAEGGIGKDEGKASEYFAKACSSGDPMGCSNVADGLVGGWSGPVDDAAAAVAYRRACDLGDGRSCNELGVLFADGKGVQRRRPAAFELFVRSCGLGNAGGCADMADYYWLGEMVAQDQPRALLLWKKACAAKVAWACDPLSKRVMPAHPPSQWSLTMKSVRDP